MKKILIIIFTLISFNSFAVDKSTTFNNEIFEKAQLDGKIVVINSWNETCTTCKVQIKILDQAEKEFTDILFLSFEQRFLINSYDSFSRIRSGFHLLEKQAPGCSSHLLADVQSAEADREAGSALGMK